MRRGLCPQERIAISSVESPEPQSRGVNNERLKTMRITRPRAIAAATAAAIALTSMAVTPAAAAPYYRHSHRGAGNAAVLGAVAGVFGLIATLAARDHYERHYGYGPYYAPSPAPYGYYGGPRPYYGY
jgi:hypothetical protein